MGNGNRSTPEFRREAVLLPRASERTRRETAEDLSIGLSTLTRWLGQEGDPTPSHEDIPMTARVAAACAAIDITVHDHIVVGREQEVSFKATGLL